MEGASRESMAAGRDRLEEVAGGDPARLAEDLRQVARLLVREPGLRRAFVDPAQSAEARRGLVTGLLGQRISDDALQVLLALVSGRWSSPSDLVTAVELLAIEAELIVAEQRAPERPGAGGAPERPGAGGAPERPGAGDSGTLSEVEDELFRFSRVVEGDPRLARALSDSTADVERRAGLVRDLLAGKATDVTVRLAEFAVAGFGGRRFDASLQRLVELTAARRDRQVAYVRVAAPLTEQQEQRMVARLSDIYGRQISLQVIVDPAVIGGATVRVGDDLYDGSVARRLEQARAALAK